MFLRLRHYGLPWLAVIGYLFGTPSGVAALHAECGPAHATQSCHAPVALTGVDGDATQPAINAHAGTTASMDHTGIRGARLHPPVPTVTHATARPQQAAVSTPQTLARQDAERAPPPKRYLLTVSFLI